MGVEVPVGVRVIAGDAEEDMVAAEEAETLGVGIEGFVEDIADVVAVGVFAVVDAGGAAFTGRGWDIGVS
jgi:hypothetical protein